MATVSLTYQDAGVNISSAERFLQKIQPLVKKTRRPEVLTEIGHYAGLFALKKYRHPVLCASTDGVGTKLKLALQMNRLQGLGQDLVAMSANDILCLGAEPLFFLDYYATGRLDPEQGTRLVEGIANACAAIHCTLLGGETAEMPSLYEGNDFDLAGFIVGVVERDNIVDGKKIHPGDSVVGVGSSGPHSNGYSLIRRIVRDRNLSLQTVYPPLKRPLGELLLEPTRLYGNSLLRLKKQFHLHGIAHITGGGFDNIPRILPASTRAVLELGSWERPPIFGLLQNWGNVAEAEMQKVFNLGVGLVLVLPEKESGPLVDGLRKEGESAWVIGRIEKRKGDQPPLEVA